MKQFSAVALLIVVACSGCGMSAAAKRAQMTFALKDFAMAYLKFCDANEAGPTGWQDLQQMERVAEAQRDLETANYTIVWGLTPRTVTRGIANTLIAYPKDGPTAGGKCVYFNGVVEDLTADQINEKLKLAATPLFTPEELSPPIP